MSCTCSDCYEGCDWDCPECGPSVREFVVEKTRRGVGRLVRRFRAGSRSRAWKTSAPDAAGLLSNEYVVDISDAIAALDADTSTFTTMLMKTQNKNIGLINDVQVSWLEDEFFPRLAPPPWLDLGLTWEDDWTTASDRRKQWERERDAAVAHISQSVNRQITERELFFGK